MSLINDALKQARKAPPRSTPSTLPPLQPVADEPSAAVWLLPAIVILLIFAAIFFIGWAVAHHTVRTIVTTPIAAPTQEVIAVSQPVAQPQPVEAPPPPPANPPDAHAPKLQGIFYSATAPSAILDGKTVRPGDTFRVYRVKAISKNAVTLVGADNKEIQIGMGN